MKKVFILGLIGVWLMVGAFSFKFNVMGYDVSYNPVKEEQVINNVDKQVYGISSHKPQNKDIPMSRTNNYEVISNKAIEPQPVHELDNDIKTLNNIKEVRKALGDLGYSRIAFTDIDTNERYIFLVDNQGTITSVYKDTAMYAEVETRGSLQKVKDYAHRGDFERLKLAVEIPFKVKLKLLLTQWF